MLNNRTRARVVETTGQPSTAKQQAITTQAPVAGLQRNAAPQAPNTRLQQPRAMNAKIQTRLRAIQQQQAPTTTTRVQPTTISHPHITQTRLDFTEEVSVPYTEMSIEDHNKLIYESEQRQYDQILENANVSFDLDNNSRNDVRLPQDDELDFDLGGLDFNF